MHSFKKIFLTTFVFVLLLGGGVFAAKDILISELQIVSNGYYKVYLPSKIGKVYMQGNYRDGEKEGRFETYDEKTGRRLELCHYYNGVKHGICKKYFSSSGDLMKVIEYFDGVPHGSFKVYHANGKLKYKAYFKYGRKNGVEKHYHENGRIARQVEYENDVKIKEQQYDIKGKLIKEDADASQ